MAQNNKEKPSRVTMIAHKEGQVVLKRTWEQKGNSGHWTVNDVRGNWGEGKKKEFFSETEPNKRPNCLMQSQCAREKALKQQHEKKNFIEGRRASQAGIST